MTIDLASVAPEDLDAITALMQRVPMEKRGEVTLRVQRAARDFLAKSVDDQRVAADGETDPVRKTVFGALAKRMPDPTPEKSAAAIDPLRREALGSLVKAVTAGAKASLGKGVAAGVLKAGAKAWKGIGNAGASVGARAGAKLAVRARRPKTLGSLGSALIDGTVAGAQIGRRAAQAAAVGGAAYGASSVFGGKKKQAA